MTKNALGFVSKVLKVASAHLNIIFMFTLRR